MIVDKAAVSRITLETYHITKGESNEMRERKIDPSSPDYFFRSKRQDLLLPLTGPVVSWDNIWWQEADLLYLKEGCGMRRHNTAKEIF